MNPRFARLLCRVLGHSLSFPAGVGWTLQGCQRCGLLVPFKREHKPRVIKP